MAEVDPEILRRLEAIERDLALCVERDAECLKAIDIVEGLQMRFASRSAELETLGYLCADVVKQVKEMHGTIANLTEGMLPAVREFKEMIGLDTNSGEDWKRG